jgi:hypothetical protein
MPSVPTIPVLRIRPRHGLAALNLVEVWAYRDVLRFGGSSLVAMVKLNEAWTH